MHTINRLTLDNCAFAFIDHQPFIAFPVTSISGAELVNNVAGMAKVAKALNIPTVISTIFADGGPLKDPVFSQLANVFPDLPYIDRTNTNAWADPNFVSAIKQTGRQKLVMCGLWTEVCLAQSVISAVGAGHDVYFVSDCSGGVSLEAHEDGKRRMVQAGATPITWLALMAELCPDNQSPEYQRLYPIVLEHGGSVGVAAQYMLAQLEAGVGKA